MKIGTFIGCAAFGALLLAATPYQFKKDEETGVTEIRSLLWALRKTPHGEGEDKDHYCFAIPPSGLDYVDEDEEEDLEDIPIVGDPAEA
ncbi:MAG: hypothetical protein K6D56_04700 [Clostridia bacterium]|nr:hypothetical protein [Clostridia bacterium]